MNKKKFLIIGYGNMGMLHSEILSDLLNDVFFDVIDIEDKKIGKQNYNQINIEQIEDINQYTGIIISTHSDSHLEYLNKLNKYKKIIFIEKPLVNNLKELDKFKKMNQKNIFCGFIETHNELFSIAKENLTADPHYIQVERISPKVEKERIKDHVDFDLTIHDLSVALQFFIEKNKISSCNSINLIKNDEGYYELNNLMLSSDNFIFNFTSSRLGQTKIRTWKIFTSNEQIRIDLIKKEVKVIKQNKKTSLINNELVQNYNEKIINSPAINPAKEQMIKYLDCLEKSTKEYNYNNLIDAHEILLKYK